MQEQDTKAALRQNSIKNFNIIGGALICLAVISVALDSGIEILLRDYSEYFGKLNLPLIYIGFDIIIKFVAFFLPFWGARNSLRYKKTVPDEKYSIFTIVTVVSLGISVYLFISFVVNAIVHVINPGWLSFEVNPAFTNNDIYVKVSYVIYFVLIAPMIDEFVFRGVIVRCFSRLGARFAMVASSFLFALTFLEQNNPVILFVLGLFMAFVTMIYKDAKISAFIHIGINLIILLGIFIPPSLSWVMGLITVIVYAISIFGLAKKFDRHLVLVQTVTFKESWKILLSSWTIIIAIILLILRSIYYILL